MKFKIAPGRWTWNENSMPLPADKIAEEFYAKETFYHCWWIGYAFPL